MSRILIFLAFLAGNAVSGELTFVSIPAGEYVRGFGHNDREFQRAHLYSTSQQFRSEQPKHRVKLTRPFELSTTEVTVGQFHEFVEATGHVTDAEKNDTGALGFFPDPENRNYVERFRTDPALTWKTPGFLQGDEHPVVCVSLRDAEAFCAWLSKKSRRTCRLPTEAEWEYACRAGKETWYSWGKDPDQAYAHANVADGTLESAHPGTTSFQRAVKLGKNEGDGAIYTAKVASYHPNPWGLFDMHGNVWEWCRDKYQEDRYERLLDGVERRDRETFTMTDPVGPETTDQHEYGDWRVTRGGSWFTAPAYTRCSIRGYAEASEAACYTGFRVLREVEE